MLRSASGRLRVGWRLLLYVILLISLAMALGYLLGPSLTARSTALLVAALAAGWLLLGAEGRPPAALGMPLAPEALQHTALGVALGTGVALGAVLVMALAGVLRWSSQPGTVVSYLGSGVATLGLLALPAAAEEAVLRGYPLQATAEAWGPGVALAATSAAFALLHAGNPGVSAAGMANIVAAGLFLGALYLRTGSLWWASGAHLGWNWAHGFGADLPVSGLDVADTPFLDAHASGPPLLSGGAFGPEGSLLATGVVLGAACWVWNTRHLRPARFTGGTPSLARLRTVPGGVRRGEDGDAGR